MGKKSSAYQEIPMRTPKPLYAEQRLIFHPELVTCPHCGEVVVSCNYLSWEKMVQTLDQVLSMACRPGRCANPECPGWQMRLLSAHGQRVAVANSTYGYDVVVRIGWLRQRCYATDEQVHADLRRHVRISESHVRSLYQRSYLPL
jgi:hypothetical protein